MMGIKKIKRFIKSLFHLIGLDLVRYRKKPLDKLNGLTYLPIHSILDVGANSGQFARYISEIFPNAKIVSFEPLPEPYHELQAWAETQHGRVRTFNLALGDQDCQTEMYSHTEFSLTSSLLPTDESIYVLMPMMKTQQKIPVEMWTLDHAYGLIKDALEPELLIKLDVQGYEDRVLHGAEQALADAAACFLEINLIQQYQGQASFIDLHNFFESVGYRYAGSIE